MELAEREGIFAGGSGIKLHYRSHRLESAPFRAAVALIEAPEARGQLYSDLVEQITPGGYAMYGCVHHELRRMRGQPGFLEEWNECYQELDAFLHLVKSLEPDAPLFLAGSQVAGQLVMTYALHHPEGLQGVISVHPRLHAPIPHSTIVVLARALSRIWPAFRPTVETHAPLDRTVEPETQVKSRSARQDVVSDPTITPATASDITIPVLVIDGDPPVTSEGERGQPPPGGSTAQSLGDLQLWLDGVILVDR